jgi:nucleotide-binding universal stress UspA family protein
MPHDESLVLFAYDGSEYARAAIEQAGRELRPGRHAIVLTIARPAAAAPLAAPAIALPNNLGHEAERDAETTADEGVELATAAGFKAAPVVARGEPVWQRIVEAADDAGASLIVLGSHGRTGISALLGGSVAQATSSHTDRAVMISHLPESSESGR